MCPSGAQSGAQKWGTWLKVGHIYYIKWGTTKYVPHWGTKWGTKVGHIYFIKWGTTKYVPQWGTKWGTFVFKIWA